MFSALLDTCVLWPGVQRDFPLSLAYEYLYRPVWSWRLLEEVEYVEEQKLIKRGASHEDAARRAAFLVDQMRGAFSDAEVVGWEGLEGTYGLPDPDDEHLVAAAVVGGAGAIVTDNTDGLPHGWPLRTVDGLLVILEVRFGMTGAVQLIREAADP